jgi:hypothetical protein
METNSIMQFIKNWWYTDQYYKIMDDGTQKSIYDSSEYKCILHIHKSTTGLHYRFIQPGQSYQTRPLSYTIFGLSLTIEHAYTLWGVSITTHRSHILPVKSFLLEGNTLDDTIVLWLCKNYLHVTPGKSLWTIIDDKVRLHTGKTIRFGDSITYS